MIRQTIYIPRYDWSVRVWYAVTGYHTRTIIKALEDIGCRGETLKQSKEQLISGGLNSGLTYSNYKMHSSVVVIALTSSANEFMNSFEHEKRHLVTHIAEACGIPMKGEEICYLDGWLSARMVSACRELACECCRKGTKRA